MERFPKWRASLILYGAAIVALWVLTQPVLATEWARKVSVSGGSARRVSSVISSAGYLGGMSLAELTICNPVTNSASIYRGNSDVNATNGTEYEPGSCYTSDTATPIDATTIYIFTASTQDVEFTVRSK